MKKPDRKLKPFQRFAGDEETEELVATADLSEYDLSAVRFEFQPKSARVNMRLPESLLRSVKARASKRGIPYQRFIREALEAAVSKGK